jgi:hypothetical protein
MIRIVRASAEESPWSVPNQKDYRVAAISKPPSRQPGTGEYLVVIEVRRLDSGDLLVVGITPFSHIRVDSQPVRLCPARDGSILLVSAIATSPLS